jgi:hypothetical protein
VFLLPGCVAVGEPQDAPAAQMAAVVKRTDGDMSPLTGRHTLWED